MIINSNYIFDKSILDDSELEIKKVDYSSKIVSIQEGISLEYTGKVKLWDENLRDILDNDKFSHEDKIKFIEKGFTDINNASFDYVRWRFVNFWRSSIEATQLMDIFLKNREHQATKTTRSQYNYLVFRVGNLYPDSYQLITDYFDKRDTVETKYQDEGYLIYKLYKLGKEKESVDLLEILVEDFISNNVKYVDFGNRDNKLSDYDGNIFDILCFSSDENTSDKATNLLFKLLKYKINFSERYNLVYLANHKDSKRYNSVLDHWFEKYSNINENIIIDKKILSLEDDEKRELLRNLFPEIDEYYFFMVTNSQYLGVKFGIKYWETFNSKASIILIYKASLHEEYVSGEFMDALTNILKGIFKNEDLTLENKKHILFQAIQIIKQSGYKIYFYNLSMYLRLVNEAYPDKLISKEDYNNLGLNEEIIPYTYPLKIRKYTPRNPINVKSISNDLVLDLNNYAYLNQFPNIEISKKELFFISLKGARQYIFNFLSMNNQVIWFDAESSLIPTNYKVFFETEFNKILKYFGINNIEVNQEIKQVSETKYYYKIFVKYSESQYTYVFEYQEEETDWYQPQRLVKMINLCLIDLQTPLRLIELNTYDQSALFVLSEPSKIISLFDKYSIKYGAINFRDEFSALKVNIKV